LEVGEAVISAQSFKGKDGLWLLDPYNIIISSSANASTTNASNTFTSSASGGVVNATTLQSALSTNDVTVSTTGAGTTDAGNITLSDSLTWSSNKTLTLSAQGVVTGSGGVTMTGGGALVIQQEGNSTSSSNPYSGIISGTGSFTKGGAGNLYFSGTSTNSTTVNSYTGNTTIRAGTLILGTVTPWGAGGTVTVANGATLDLNGKAVTSTNALVLNGSFSQYVGALSNSGASTGSYAGPITLGSASTIGGSNVINLTSTNPITGAYDLTLAGNSSVVSTITGDIATGTGGLIVNGSIPSTLWRINGNNSYTGNTLISKGKLRLGSATPWVAGGTVTVSNGSTLDLNGQTVTSTNALTLNGFFFSTEGALSNSSTTTIRRRRNPGAIS
jgi:autotransporter-associated beta strand protein